MIPEPKIPAPGGGFYEGLGGQAPSFAPGGIDNPYPPSAGMPPAPLLEAEELFTPDHHVLIPGAQSAVGGQGAGSLPMDISTGLPFGANPIVNPVYPTTSGVQMPQQQPTPQQMQQGFMARIIPVYGGGPLPPGIPPGPSQPIPPTIGGGPVMPPMIPPTVGGGPVIPPGEGGGPIQGKPKGLKTCAPPPGATPPTSAPKPPGQWVTLDAGKGQPPAWAFIESTGPGSDDGLEGVPTPKPSSGVTKPTPPTGGEKGHYVPVVMPYVVAPLSDSDADDVIWAWVPTIDDTYGVKVPEPEPKKSA